MKLVIKFKHGLSDAKIQNRKDRILKDKNDIKSDRNKEPFSMGSFLMVYRTAWHKEEMP